MERYVCIHGHFYQPPRENPWLEAIELQDSAYPFHNWNERITAECYAPNATSRILDDQDRITSIVNNYARISFNFGPTLLSWMEEHSPDVYAAIIEADVLSRSRFSGHGSALAQAYNHMILPLANRRDKRSQVLWGVRDFERRFGREPEGMWLPETAVDVETLEVLAECGIRFTLLAPSQAKRVRKLGARHWRDVSDGRVDPTQAYLVKLPSKAEIVAFFYDGPISRGIAFEGLLDRGERFADRLHGAFDEGRAHPQLVHVATDGETYGHHHRHGEMALSYALHKIETGDIAQLTNYGEYLERHPPTMQADVIEQTAWSCVHGVGRWWRDCGCSSGAHPGWNQSWREPLRNSLDWLRDSLAPEYEAACGELLKNPWAGRDDYIDVILDRSAAEREHFLARHATRELSPDEQITLWKLLEMQRHLMLAYTSCGWFFDDISGIETVQVIQYAGAAIQLAAEIFRDPEQDFLTKLAEAKSNRPGEGDGAAIFGRSVKPAFVDLEKVAAHYAISSLFQDYAETEHLYAYDAALEERKIVQTGKVRLVFGRARFTSRITTQAATISFGVLHFGDHNLNAGVREFRGAIAFEEMVEDAASAFEKADTAAVIRIMDRHFGVSSYSLRSLFRDERRRILDMILDSSLEEATAIYSQVYENNAPLMRFLSDLGLTLPKAFETGAEFVLNARIKQALEEAEPDIEKARGYFGDARREGVSLDAISLAFTLRKALERLAARLAEEPADLDLVTRLNEGAAFAVALPFEVGLDRIQNTYYRVLKERYEGVASSTPSSVEDSAWVESFRALGEKLHVQVEA